MKKNEEMTNLGKIETVKDVVAEKLTSSEGSLKVEEGKQLRNTVTRVLVHHNNEILKVENIQNYDVTTKIYIDSDLPHKAKQEVKEPVKEVVPASALAEPVVVKQKAEFVPFPVRLKKADKALKAAYNELKSEILSYGIKSRISSTGDTFRLHTKTYVKIVIVGKSLKMYMALKPKDYKDSPIPFDDASKMVAHKETPFVFKVKSDLSLRRAKQLIADCAKKDDLKQGEVVQYNHAKDVA